MAKQFSSFEDFTNLYSLSKTLRFELVPVGNTFKMLEEEDVIKRDETRKKMYEKTKPYIDRLHRDFVQASLKDFKFRDLSGYETALKTYLTDKNKKKDFEKVKKDLYKEVVQAFNDTAEIWATTKFQGLKKKNIEFLFEKKVFKSVLLPLYGLDKDGNYIKGTTEIIRMKDKNSGEIVDEKEISIFEGWEGFIGYFKKFFETRRNFYKSDGTSTAIATRIVDNLKRCFENKWLVEEYPDELLKNFDLEKIAFITDVENFGSFSIQGKKGENGKLGFGIDGYNEIIGEIRKEVNLYNQKNKTKIKHLKTLDKQILSPKEKFISEIETDEELKTELINLLKTGKETIKILNDLFTEFVRDNNKFDLNNIYFSAHGFDVVSSKWTTDKDSWQTNLVEVFKKYGHRISKRNDKMYKFPQFIPLQYIKEALEMFSEEERTTLWKSRYIGDNENGIPAKISREENIWQQFLDIFYFEFSNILEKKFVVDKLEDKKAGLVVSAQNLQNLLDQKSLKRTPELTTTIKNYADELLNLYRLSKYFSLEYKKNWNPDDLGTDEYFYGRYYDKFLASSYEKIVQPYNRLRNYLTKKPWEKVQKWKLNFENPTLAAGWDKNKERDNTAVILRKDGKYFLGVMKKENNDIFMDKYKEKFAGNGFEKMVYKLLPGANKMLPKVFFSKSNIEYFAPSSEVLRIRNTASYSKNGKPQKGYTKEEFNLEDCHLLIDFFKDSLEKHWDWKFFNFKFSPTSEYKDISEFYREVENQGYSVTWENISEEYIQEKNNNGELYLFQIKNKDWNEKASGRKNIHTIYFENLFSEENTRLNFPMKLNGEAEIFFRPIAVKAKKVNRAIKLKDSSHEIIEKKRYTEDKILFHLPITLNRTAGQMTMSQFNEHLNKFLANNTAINILGIDRGEKHIAYYSLIDQQGIPIDSGSLNIIGNKDYHYELEKRAKSREQQRKDWMAIEGIKDLKKGYISQVVHKLTTLAIEHNAIIVFEDLNMRFKQIRGGIEKSAYQQLEKALIDKLSFSADKTRPVNEIGGALNAYQLSAPIEAFKDIGKQTGIIFYTTASYTSKIDPVTGWRPNIYIKTANAKINKENILKFDNIKWNADKNRFDITYDLKNFSKQKNSNLPSKTVWTVCSNVERWRWNRTLNNNKGGYEEYPAEGEGSITEKLKALLEEYNIDVSNDILQQIAELDTKGNERFFSQFLFYFKLILQIRNTDGKLHEKIRALKESGKYDATNPEVRKLIFESDFILSPVEPFFDSRRSEEFERLIGRPLPKNGDDNGAYNIARKGIMLLERINEWANIPEDKRVGKKRNPDLFISNKDWDEFLSKF